MDKEACGETVVVVTDPAAAPDAAQTQHAAEPPPPPPPPDPARRLKRARLWHAIGHCGRLFVLGVAAYGILRAAHLSMSDDEARRRHGRELAALLAAGYAVAAALVFLWLRSAIVFVARFVRDVLVDLVVILFLLRVAELAPPALAPLAWCGIAALACGAVYVVDEQFCRNEDFGNDVGCDGAAAGDCKTVEKIRSADEKV